MISTDVCVIEPEELFALLEDDSQNIKILDATFVLPGNPENPRNNFLAERIDHAQFFDVDEIADHSTSLPHMLPPEADFERAVSALGISSDDRIIIYAQHGMVMGPARAWWMFRTFSHDNVWVLNGGLPAWKAAGLPLNRDAPLPPQRAIFRAAFKKDLVLDIDQMKSVSFAQTRQILDARPRGRFTGAEAEPRPGLRSGHIPFSLNVPASSLVDPETGKIKPMRDIAKIFGDSGFSPEAPVCTTCGSGVTACMLALALYHLGYKDVAVYDGSWAEWGAESQDTEVVCAIA